MGRKLGLVVLTAVLLLSGCGHDRHVAAADWVVFASDRDGRWDVYAVHPGGGGLIRVTGRRDEMEPQLASSPNGRKLAIINPGGTTVIDTTGRKETHRGGDMYALPLVSNDGRVTVPSREGPTIFPDRRHRAFVGRDGFLWIAPKHDGRARKVARTGWGPAPIWSPDGRWLTFEIPRGKRTRYLPIYQVAVVRGDGSGLRVLTHSTQGVEAYPSGWSADSRRVLFVRGNSSGFGRAVLNQVWTSDTDGSDAQALTHAYPSGGDNIRPVWFHGKLEATRPVPPMTRVTRAGGRWMLHTRYFVGEVRTTRGRVAVLPLPHSPQTPRPTAPLLVWKPRTGATASWPIPACAWPEGLLVDGSMTVFDCNNSCCDTVDESLVVFRAGDPVPFEAARGQGSGETGGSFLKGYGLDEGILVYGQSREVRRHVVGSGLWRQDQDRRIRIGGLAGTVIGYAGRHVAVLQPQAVAVFDADGRLAYRVALLHREFAEPNIVLGRLGLVALLGRRLRAWDSRTGRPLGSWTVPLGSQLDDVTGDRAVFTAGRTLHVLDLRDGHQTILRFPAATISPSGSSTTGFYAEAPIRADLDGQTLVVSYNVASRGAEPGRIVVLHLP
jgi:WD40 repeat protein